MDHTGRRAAMITYKPLRKLLVERNMKKTDLVEMGLISTGTLAKLGKDRYVGLEIIDKLCTGLDCKISDIVEYEGRNPNL